MADNADEPLSVAQFNYCSLCKTSYKKRKKHAYSQRHREIVQNILAKFKRKVLVGREKLGAAEVEPLYTASGTRHVEAGAKFWCYFCLAEVDKHEARVDCLVKFAAFLQHIARADHSVKVGEFLWENFVLDKKWTKDLTLPIEKLDKFLKQADTLVSEFRATKQVKLMKEAEKIRRKEQRQANIMQQVLQVCEESGTAPDSASRVSLCQQQQQQEAAASQTAPLSIPPARSGRPRAVAMGAGLTSVDLSKLPMEGEEEEGNVHTGAVPPWLRQEQTPSKPGAVIGPSMEDFTKHLERQKKGKLPPNRVGANFNRSASVSQSWLPNFGGVWNKGRRSNTREDKGGGGQRGQDTTRHRALPTGGMDPLSTHSSLPSVIIPYKRRRTSSAATSTVTSSMLLSDQSASQSLDLSAGPSAGLSAGELTSQPAGHGINHSAGPSGFISAGQSVEQSAMESAGLSTAQSAHYWTGQSSHPSTSHFAGDPTSVHHHHHQSHPLQTSTELPPWNQALARIPPPPLSAVQESESSLNRSMLRTGFPGHSGYPDQHRAMSSGIAVAQGLASNAPLAEDEVGIPGVVVPYRRKRKSHVDNSTEGTGARTNSWMGTGTIVPSPQVLKANLPGS